jgi:hypothetical protein
MAALVPRNGHGIARKGIPADVRDKYARLYGVRVEAHLKLPGGTPRHEAKVRLGEWEAEIETRMATLRAQRKGEGRPLTKLNAIALAGRWYIWYVKQHEADPGPAKHWRHLGEHLMWDVLHPHARPFSSARACRRQRLTGGLWLPIAPVISLGKHQALNGDRRRELLPLSGKPSG